MAPQAIALGHFALARTWLWLTSWVAICSSCWVLPLIFHGSYSAAMAETFVGPLLPLGMIAGAVGMVWAAQAGLALLTGGVALRAESGRVTYVSRWLISFKIDQVSTVGLGRDREQSIIVHLANGRTKTIPTRLLAEPADEIVRRIQSMRALELNRGS